MSVKPWVGRVLIALSIATLLPHVAAAQVTSAASISGVVTDSSGGVVPGVAVEIFSQALTQTVGTTTTNEKGEYRIVELRPGTYTVTFKRQGFATLWRGGSS
jgi:protocatechuate 3,4-dioxygenase beta subunit